MTKRINPNHLTIYRRHAGSCNNAGGNQSRCECPLWIHGRVRGKFIRQSLDTRSLATAEMKRADLLVRGLDPEPPDGPKGIHVAGATNPDAITLEQAAQDFLSAKKSKGTNTVKLYTRAVEHFRRWCEVQNITMLKQVDRTHVQAYFAEFSPTWKRNTAQSRLVHLRVFFSHCVRERDWLTKSPAVSRDLNYPKPNGKSSSRLPFTPAEVTRILEAVDEMPADEEDPVTHELLFHSRDRARALILLLLYTGMRISDATFLERQSIDGDGLLSYWIIKTRKELPCAIELNPKAVAALQALPASRVYFFQTDRDDDYQEARLALRSGEEFSPVMPGYEARVRETTTLVLRVLKIAGLPGACHRFRDTFAVSMLKGGEPLTTVCEFLGHSDVRITREHYEKHIDEYRKQFAKRARVLNYEFPLVG